MKITLIGLGVREGDMSMRAVNALTSGAKVLARTALAPSFASVKDYGAQPLDELFARSRNFDTLNRRLAKAVLDAAKQQDVVYCVDGAVCEDNACKIILARHRDTEVIEGVSKAARAACLAKVKGSQVTGISAYDIKNLKSSPAVAVYDIDSFFAASEVKLALSDLFGEETVCAFIRGDAVKRIKIYELDRQKDYDMSCAAVVEESDFLHKDRYDYADLLQMVRMLRAPGGCPWDRAQTCESIRINMVEEAYELVDAINKGDDDMMEEETGDVLLQAAFHTVMKEEQGAFTSEDVTTRVVKKLIFRHSHIFGKDRAADEDAALGVWEKNKRKEKHMTTFGETVQAVPVSFPACMRAQKVQKRASKAGLDKSKEQSAADIRGLISSPEEKLSEADCGRLLFEAVRLCRLNGADSEQCLADAAESFANAFVKAEQLALAEGRELPSLSEKEWSDYLRRAYDALAHH